MLASRWDFILVKLLFEVPPKMFNRVEVRRLCRPLHNTVPIVCKPLFSLFAPVLGVCKGNLTDLRRGLHLSLAKGNPK
jgi:hypothetical protein